jgi:Rod binding domain-containing protein
MDPVASVTAATSESPQPRLLRAAHEFEAQLMKELLKPLTASGSLGGEDGDADSGSGGALGEFASEALGKGLSERGGLGIADSIVRALSHSGNEHGTGKVTGNPRADTVMRAPE